MERAAAGPDPTALPPAIKRVEEFRPRNENGAPQIAVRSSSTARRVCASLEYFLLLDCLFHVLADNKDCNESQKWAGDERGAPRIEW